MSTSVEAKIQRIENLLSQMSPEELQRHKDQAAAAGVDWRYFAPASVGAGKPEPAQWVRLDKPEVSQADYDFIVNSRISAAGVDPRYVTEKMKEQFWNNRPFEMHTWRKVEDNENDDSSTS